MTYSLAAAAAATDTDESTILKSIEGGKISATKDDRGEWRIEPAELHRLYSRITTRGSDSEAARCAASAADAMDLEGQIAVLIKQAGDRLRQQLDDVQHCGHDTWRDQLQAPQEPPSGKPERHPWWRRIAG
jgi:predicted site-specific integrase-resolvase